MTRPAPRRALITGLTGQDGSYLAELLLDRGYEVHGLVRRSATPSTENIQHLLDDPGVHGQRLFTHIGDVCDPLGLHRLLERTQPDEVYHLAAQSRVDVSFEVPHQTLATNLLGTQAVLDAIRAVNPRIRMYQASSSEMFGQARELPQSERTPFHPRSPYAVSKVAAYWACVNHRESYGLFVCNGILFNHESPRRGRAFVTRKVARGVALIARGRASALHLGNLDARRDWGYAPEYVEAMWRMLQQPEPGDYVVATGRSHSVRELVQHAAAPCRGIKSKSNPVLKLSDDMSLTVRP